MKYVFAAALGIAGIAGLYAAFFMPEVRGLVAFILGMISLGMINGSVQIGAGKNYNGTDDQSKKES